MGTVANHRSFDCVDNNSVRKRQPFRLDRVVDDFSPLFSAKRKRDGTLFDESLEAESKTE